MATIKKNNKNKEFIYRVLIAMLTDTADLLEAAERIQAQVAAIAQATGITLT